MDYTYLLINFFTIIIPLLFSFHPKLNFYKLWYAFFPAAIVTGILFIAWDSWFTHMGVWSFNPRYLTGIELVNLPLGEILFFFCIPYACVFTYHCLDILFEEPFSKGQTKTITGVLTVSLLIMAILFYEIIYTAFTFSTLAVVLILSQYVFKINWLGKFYVVYALLLVPFFAVNGLLTGTALEEPVVLYNEMEIIGLRLSTIPIEDIFYGMELILVNLLIYNWIKK